MMTNRRVKNEEIESQEAGKMHQKADSRDKIMRNDMSDFPRFSDRSRLVVQQC